MKYKSEKARRRFLWFAGILSAIFITLNISYVWLIYGYFMPSIAFIMSPYILDIFYLNGSTYLIMKDFEVTLPLSPPLLKGIHPGEIENKLSIRKIEGGKLVRVTDITSEPLSKTSQIRTSVIEVDELNDGDDNNATNYKLYVYDRINYENKTWIIYEDGYFTFDGEELSGWIPNENLGERPIAAVWKDDLVVFSKHRDHCEMIKYSNGQWQEPENFNPDIFCPPGERCRIPLCFSCGENILADGNTLHHFMSFGRKYYYRYSNGDGFSEWKELGEFEYSATPMIDKDGLLMVTLKRYYDNELPYKSLVKKSMLLYRFQNEELTEPKEFPFKIFSYGFFPVVDEQNLLHFFDEDFGFFCLKLIRHDIENDQVVNSTTIKVRPELFAFIFELINSYITGFYALIAVMFVMSFGFMIIMWRYRQNIHRLGNLSTPYASVMRRGIAQGIDFFIVFLLGVLFPYLTFINGNEASFDFLWQSSETFVKWCLASIIAFLALLLIYHSIFEGILGRTPGKAILKIRVLGDNLEPFGMKRAFICNILKIVDGLFNFLPGILVIAFSEKWQRIGDMAAGTIVIHGKPEAKESQ